MIWVTLSDPNAGGWLDSLQPPAFFALSFVLSVRCMSFERKREQGGEEARALISVVMDKLALLICPLLIACLL